MKKAKIILLAGAALLVLLIASQVINAAKYEMVVNVVEGDNIMGVNPTTDRLDFGDLSKNNGMTRYVTLKSEGGSAAYVLVWTFGEISELVSLNQGSFVLEPGKEKKLALSITIPSSAETRQYTGGVWMFKVPKLF